MKTIWEVEYYDVTGKLIKAKPYVNRPTYQKLVELNDKASKQLGSYVRTKLKMILK